MPLVLDPWILYNMATTHTRLTPAMDTTTILSMNVIVQLQKHLDCWLSECHQSTTDGRVLVEMKYTDSKTKQQFILRFVNIIFLNGFGNDILWDIIRRYKSRYLIKTLTK